MNRTRNIAYAALMACTAFPALAEVPVSDYPRFKNDPSFGVYVGGIGMGLNWANALLAAKGQQELYCLPKGFNKKPGFYLEILDEEIQLQGLSKKRVIEADLAFGLVRRYPCR